MAVTVDDIGGWTRLTRVHVHACGAHMLERNARARTHTHADVYRMCARTVYVNLWIWIDKLRMYVAAATKHWQVCPAVSRVLHKASVSQNFAQVEINALCQCARGVCVEDRTRDEIAR